MSDHECDSGDFDRTTCAEPCGAMHSYCATCGKRQDPCAHEGRPVTDLSEDREQVAEVLYGHRAVVSGDGAGWFVLCTCGYREPGTDVSAHLADALLGGVVAGIVATEVTKSLLRSDRGRAAYDQGAADLRARVEALADEWTTATCQMDGAPCSWHRVAAECAVELRSVLATGPQEDAETGQKRAVGGLGGGPAGERASEGGEAL